ncbi:MAG: helix-turn-helix domain-containing protein [Candidatus Acidiferrales bacterium]
MTAVLEKPDILDGVPKIITSDAQNDRYIAALLELERRGHPTPAEKNLAEVLTLLVEAYEEERYPVRSASPVEVLKELLGANNLRQKDLAPLLGSESVVSEVLGGKRELNKHHIEKLSKRFGVSPAVFF